MSITGQIIAPSKTACPAMLVVAAAGEAQDDGRNLAELVRHRFGSSVRLRQASNSKSAMEHLQSDDFDVVLIDGRLSKLETLPILNRVCDLPHGTAVAVVDCDDTGQGGEWIQREADDFIVADELSPRRIEVVLAKANRARRLRRENKHMHKQLRHAGKEFEHFVRALSHDMMANFMLLESSFSQLKSALPTEGESEAYRMFAHVKACLDESKRFLDDLVQLAKTGSVEMEPQRVELQNIVSEVMFEQSELIERGGISVTVEPPLPEVWCNRQRVKQVVTNLVRNAIKHGCDQSEPKITISAKTLPGGGLPLDEGPGRGGLPAMVLLRVHDNGLGIESRMHEEIFLPGKRLPTASEEGSGMGLAIVRKIAEHYGGSAWVDRQATFGTGFIVSLPTVPPEVAQPANAVNCEDEDEPEATAARAMRQPSPAALHRPHRSPRIMH